MELRFGQIAHLDYDIVLALSDSLGILTIYQQILNQFAFHHNPKFNIPRAFSRANMAPQLVQPAFAACLPDLCVRH